MRISHQILITYGPQSHRATEKYMGSLAPAFERIFVLEGRLRSDEAAGQNEFHLLSMGTHFSGCFIGPRR